jgi:cohesin complex subunit SA-1/2
VLLTLAPLNHVLTAICHRVFVHRYRDLDPNIRAECVRAIGLWFKRYPGHFLDGAYLRYVGWVLSDSNTHVRLEAVKSLSGVYEQVDYIGSLNHFTERFKPRLIEMATSDTELGIRVAVIQVLGAIDGHSLLEDEEREKLNLLVFDAEAKIRKAVSKFVRGVWDDCVEERLVGRKATEQDKARAGVKALAILLVKWGKALDKEIGLGDDDNDSGMEDVIAPAEASSKPKEVATLVGLGQKGRVALVVEALWDEVDVVRDWEGLLDVLLLDHSAAGEVTAETPRKRRANGKGNKKDAGVDEAWRLEEIEESILLEVLVAAIQRAKMDIGGAKKASVHNISIVDDADS